MDAYKDMHTYIRACMHTCIHKYIPTYMHACILICLLAFFLPFLLAHFYWYLYSTSVQSRAPSHQILSRIPEARNPKPRNPNFRARFPTPGRSTPLPLPRPASTRCRSRWCEPMSSIATFRPAAEFFQGAYGMLVFDAGALNPQP